MKRKMFNPLFSSSLYRQNNEARVGKAGGNGQVSLGSRGWESGARGAGRGVAVYPGPGSRLRAALRTRAPLYAGDAAPGGGAVGGGRRRGSHRVGQSALCAPRCRCLPPAPPPRDGSSSHKETPPQRLRNRCPSLTARFPAPAAAHPRPLCPPDFLSPSPPSP